MDLSLKNKKWSEYIVENLFDLKIGENVDGNKINKSSGKTAYITRKESNNGLDGFIEYDKFFLNSEKPVITIGNETAEPFVQDYSFYTGTKVNILIPKTEINKYALLFISQSLKMHKSKYSYSFTINSTRLKRQKILLPTNIDAEPDYEFMETYMLQKAQEKIDLYRNYICKRISELENVKKVLPLTKKNWGEFFLNDIFNKIQRGKRLKKDSHKMGKMPYISSTAMNNGVDGFVDNKDKVRIFSSCLSLANSGSVGTCFYQPYKFVASDHVTKLENGTFNKYIYLFISTIVSRLGEKYSFNREINDARIKREKILLPINANKNPDYEYMEKFMKNIELKKLKNYLRFKDSDQPDGVSIYFE
jgi:hypothetical protein